MNWRWHCDDSRRFGLGTRTLMLLNEVNAFDDRHSLFRYDFQNSAASFLFLTGYDLNEIVFSDMEGTLSFSFLVVHTLALFLNHFASQ
jgi:hypothetical protein